MELDQLGVADAAACEHCQAEGITSVFVPPAGRASPDAGVPSGSEHHGVGMDPIARPVRELEAIGTEDPALGDKDARDVNIVQYRNVELGGAIYKRALNFQARLVAAESRPAERMSTEETLADPSIFLAGEWHAIAFQVADTLGGPLGDDLHDLRVRKIVALQDCVGGVLLPTVIRIHCAESGVDAS